MCSWPSTSGAVIRLERADSNDGRGTARAPSIRNLIRLCTMRATSIVPDGKKGLAVIAETSAGLFYGAQTVKQLIRGIGQRRAAA